MTKTFDTTSPPLFVSEQHREVLRLMNALEHTFSGSSNHIRFRVANNGQGYPAVWFAFWLPIKTRREIEWFVRGFTYAA